MLNKGQSGRSGNRLVDMRLQGNRPGDADAAGRLTREQLQLLEQRKKTPAQRAMDFVITLLPMLCCLIAVLEYLLVPDRYDNDAPERYLVLLVLPAVIYAVFWAVSLSRLKSTSRLYQRLRYKAPLYAAVFLLLAVFDFATLKTGYLTQPFIPWVNSIINAAIGDWQYLGISTLYTLRLLFLGYFSGVAAGLITGIACGYSQKVRYWVDPIIRILGPIPTATWVPLVMILAASLFGGSVFIVALGTWFAVTIASMTGIANIDRSYFEAARTLGAKGSQLVFRVAIPQAMPSILQGMTQGMSSACVSLMVAEMLGVEAGLGWYITWAKAWAMYNRLFAAIVVICLVFNTVTKSLNLFKKRVLRWQEGMVK